MNIQKIREDFPALKRNRNGKPPIYFDNACMAMKPRQVIEALNKYYMEFPGCAGHGRSAHWFAGEVGHECAEARVKLQKLINARSCDEVIFIRNTTEGLNLVANGLEFHKGDIVLTTDREHNSNLCPWRNLNAKGIIKHRIVRSNPDNTFSLGNLEDQLRKGGVRLVSVVHSSNLDGYTIPVKEVIEISHRYDAQVMLDAAQSTPHKVIDVQDLNVDFLVFSVHKMGGPTGMGVLYGKMNLLRALDYFIVGGDTVSDTFYDKSPVYLDLPYRFEAGLQNYAGMMGSGAAAKYLMQVGLANIAQYEYELNSYLTNKLLQYEEIEIVGPTDPELRGGILTFVLKRTGLSDIAERFDTYANIMVRTGRFCVNSWFNDRRFNQSAIPVRASVYIYNTLEECDVFLETLERIVQETKDLPSLELYEGT